MKLLIALVSIIVMLTTSAFKQLDNAGLSEKINEVFMDAERSLELLTSTKSNEMSDSLPKKYNPEDYKYDIDFEIPATDQNNTYMVHVEASINGTDWTPKGFISPKDKVGDNYKITIDISPQIHDSKIVFMRVVKVSTDGHRTYSHIKTATPLS
jgi:hypothetical protein